LTLLVRSTRRGICPIVLGLVLVCAPFTHSVPSAQQADAQAVFNQALGLLQSGKTADALSVIDDAIAAGARDPALYNLKGLAAGELGRNQEAEDSFRTVIRLNPNVAMGYNNLGVLLAKLGRHQEAANAFREAQTREPQNFNALLGLGTSLAALHNYDDAASYLQKAWNLQPGDFQCGYEWAHALLEAMQLPAAKKVLNQLSVPQEPDSAAKYYSLAGVVAERMNEFASAAKYYGQAYGLTPGSYDIYLALVRSTLSMDSQPGKTTLPTPPPGLSASQNLALGLLFASRNLFEQATPRFEAALQADPSNEVAILNLALAEKSTGKSSEAMARLQSTLASHPSAVLYDALGSMDEESGQYVDAVRNYQRAVELDPTNEQYYFDLGVEYLIHFTFGPAAEVYRVGTQKFPTSSRQYLGLGFSHYAVREYRQAADAFTTALELDPESPAVFRAWNSILDSLPPNDWAEFLPRLDRIAKVHPLNAELAFCLGAAILHSEIAKGPQANLDRSQTLLEKSVRLRPDFPAAHLELGALYAAKKMNQKAVDQYLEVVRLDPKSEVPHYRLGQLYREMNQLDLARTELSQYQQLAQLHQEELKRRRSTIQQFIVPQTTKPDN
jgi:tetratricopeptide (TPR) repeat protein